MASSQQRHHTAADIAKLEKEMAREEKQDERMLKNAKTDLVKAEKMAHKAEKATDKAIHHHDKAIKYEHKTEKKMHDAIRVHEQAIKDEQRHAKDIAVKQDSQVRAVDNIEAKKAALAKSEQKAEIDQQNRDARYQALSSATTPVTTSGPSAA
ncbi:hypothetical protein FRC03_002323 [Tulasnella sp. 419]|nr:hypothetical protein FRC02_005622 [Tulasnella sp. 418]KAG8963985.1 hypothetical protein FRC03_002323 [Tulasnella sp. 419]